MPFAITPMPFIDAAAIYADLFRLRYDTYAMPPLHLFIYAAMPFHLIAAFTMLLLMPLIISFTFLYHFRHMLISLRHIAAITMAPFITLMLIVDYILDYTFDY